VTQRLDQEVEKERLKYEEKLQEMKHKHALESKTMKEEEQIAREQWMEQYQIKIDE
jgi:hypothetical protein